MIRLERPALSEAAAKALEEMGESYLLRRSPQWAAFQQGRVRASWKVFDEVRRRLLEMTAGKCAACESPAADTVEHVRPKGTLGNELFVFSWKNLLPLCGVCNRWRENSGVERLPINPAEKEPLDQMGWTDYGVFMARPGEQACVEDTVRAYGLQRFNAERQKQRQRVRFLLALCVQEEPLRAETRAQLQQELATSTPWLGPVRELLLRPGPQDRPLIDAALGRHPWIKELVAPWLRPPAWASAR